jgi:Tetratricopeptide repeat
VAADRAALAALLDGQGKYDEAEPLYRQALSVFERVLEPAHPHLLACWENCAGLS